MKLREYQKTALDVIHADLQTQQNVLLSAIMGAGKTVITARLINKYYKTTDRQFLILAHKQELVEQFYKTFITKTEIPKKDIGICCTSLKQKQINRRVTIGTVQTFINHVNDYNGCNLLIVDECHKIFVGTGSQYDQIIDMLRAKTPNMRLLGLTATPYRLGSGYIYGDRCKPGTINLFPKINHKITYAELKDKGYLMPLEGQVAFDDQLVTDLNNVDKNGDYILEQLGLVMTQQIHIDTAVEAIEQYANGYKHICVFACTINHAEQLQEAINIKFPGQVTTVHSKLFAIERINNMEAWKTGRKRIITSVNILVEGFDFPPLDCLVMARPTESTGLFLQAIGRVLRIAEGKEKALLIDLTTNTKKFGTDLDNMKVVIPKSAAEQGKKKSEKYCPECDEKVHIAIRTCPKCGYEWTQEENEKIIAKQMPELKQVIFKKEKLFPDIPPTWHEVYDISANVHTSKKNKKKLGKISLYYDLENEMFADIGIHGNTCVNVWLCFPDYYEGYAVEKAKKTWAQFTDNGIFPESVEEFQEAINCGDIKMPVRILLDHNKKWPEIKEIEFRPSQDYDIPF